MSRKGWGPFGRAGVMWGDMSHFMPFVATLNPWFPSAVIPLVGWIATLVETVLGSLLVYCVVCRGVGVRARIGCGTEVGARFRGGGALGWRIHVGDSQPLRVER